MRLQNREYLMNSKTMPVKHAIAGGRDCPSACFRLFTAGLQLARLFTFLTADLSPEISPQRRRRLRTLTRRGRCYSSRLVHFIR